MATFEVADSVGTGVSTAYIGYEFDSNVRTEIRFSTKINTKEGEEKPTGNVCFAVLQAEDDNLVALYYTPEGGILLQNWQYEHYPFTSTYPAPNMYPTGQSQEPTAYPGAGIYPQMGAYPIDGQPDPKIALQRSNGEVTLDLLIRGLGTYQGESDLYCEKFNDFGRRVSGSAYGTMLNWQGHQQVRFLIGAINATDTRYSLVLTDPLLEGETFEDEWYWTAGYDGFRVSDTDRTIKWQGARKVGDPSTYSEFTDLRNLARYDYARPEVEPAEAVEGIRWKLPPETS